MKRKNRNDLGASTSVLLSIAAASAAVSGCASATSANEPVQEEQKDDPSVTEPHAAAAPATPVSAPRFVIDSRSLKIDFRSRAEMKVEHLPPRGPHDN